MTPKADVEDWSAFADRIDVRSPGEFAQDHMPGALNLPILDDAERTLVGTMYVQQSAFDARKVGAALVARNIARICETHVRDKRRDWSPLVYCWRGGQRSRALVHVLSEIGFRAVQLDGGYRAYRRHVVSTLAKCPEHLDFRVVCGLTGSGKTRLIEAIAVEGGQVLDLEGLASHRGSLLGERPHDPQPTQKMFESALFAALAAFDRSRPVFVESESRKIGKLQLPDGLLASLRSSPCIRLDAPRALRVAMLAADYAHWAGDTERLQGRLASLVPLHGKAAIGRWADWVSQGSARELIEDLLDVHYDPSYERAIVRNFPRYRNASVIHVDDAAPTTFKRLARQLITMDTTNDLDRQAT
jgi:tRNA 2-selenouridine synthase